MWYYYVPLWTFSGLFAALCDRVSAQFGELGEMLLLICIPLAWMWALVPILSRRVSFQDAALLSIVPMLAVGFGVRIVMMWCGLL